MFGSDISFVRSVWEEMLKAANVKKKSLIRELLLKRKRSIDRASEWNQIAEKSQDRRWNFWNFWIEVRKLPIQLTGDGEVEKGRTAEVEDRHAETVKSGQVSQKHWFQYNRIIGVCIRKKKTLFYTNSYRYVHRNCSLYLILDMLATAWGPSGNAEYVCRICTCTYEEHTTVTAIETHKRNSIAATEQWWLFEWFFQMRKRHIFFLSFFQKWEHDLYDRRPACVSALCVGRLVSRLRKEPFQGTSRLLRISPVC